MNMIIMEHQSDTIININTKLQKMKYYLNKYVIDQLNKESSKLFDIGYRLKQEYCKDHKWEHSYDGHKSHHECTICQKGTFVDYTKLYDEEEAKKIIDYSTQKFNNILSNLRELVKETEEIIYDLEDK
jgi:hypothetical protein